LSECKSNNSRDLSISVGDIIQDKRLRGLKILLNHIDFGPLFACVINAKGNMISELNDNLVAELTPQQILTELSKYGFLITFNPREHLPGNQLAYLQQLIGFGYDKIRILNVWKLVNGVKAFNWYVVGFNANKNEFWLNNGYSPSDKEFMEALRNGSAINISAYSKTNNWSWSWLDYIADIGDILEDNSLPLRY